MRVIVCGGRDFGPYTRVSHWLLSIGQEKPITKIVTGACATGADHMAEAWARANGVPVETFPSDWRKHGFKAGPLRNQTMVDAGADLVVAFPGGKGTADCVRRARRAGLHVVEVPR